MNARFALLAASPLFAIAVACSGKVTDGGVTECGESASCALPDGGAGNGNGNGNDGGNGTCTVASLTGQRACVPGTAKAGVPLSLDVEAEGCLGCFTSLQPCDVTIVGNVITVSLSAKSCPPAGDVACPAVCELPKTTCTIPALTAGTYRVFLDDEPVGTSHPRTLVVDASGDDTSCTLPYPGTPVPELDPTSFSQACTSDDDCVGVVTGDPCNTGCNCPGAAIARSGLADYESNARELASLCSFREPKPECLGDCANVTPQCVANRCVLRAPSR